MIAVIQYNIGPFVYHTKFECNKREKDKSIIERFEKEKRKQLGSIRPIKHDKWRVVKRI